MQVIKRTISRTELDLLQIGEREANIILSALIKYQKYVSSGYTVYTAKEVDDLYDAISRVAH